MSYYMDEAGGVNDCPQEEDFAHYPTWSATQRAHRYSHSYEADQWRPTRPAPRKPHLLKTEKQAHQEAVRFVLEAREARRAKKGSIRAIDSGQDAGVKPAEVDAKPKEKKPAAPAPARRPAPVVEAPSRRDQSDWFKGRPDDNDPDGGIFSAAGEQQANPFAGLDWTSVEAEAPAASKRGKHALTVGEKPRREQVALSLEVVSCPATNRYICRQADNKNWAEHGNTITVAVASMVENCGGLPDEACARVRYMDADLTFWWSPRLGEIFSEADRPAFPGDLLEEAAKRGDVGGMRAALAGGASADSLQRALDAAAEAGNTLDCLYLIQQGADPSDRYSAALAKAALAGQAETCQLLIDHGALSALMRDREKSALMKCLLTDAAPERSKEQEEAYHRLTGAAGLADIEGMREGLAGLAPGDAHALNMAMIRAQVEDQPKAVAWLLDHGARPSWDGSRTLEDELGLAIFLGKTELALLYVERGADPAKVDPMCRGKLAALLASAQEIAPCA